MPGSHHLRFGLIERQPLVDGDARIIRAAKGRDFTADAPKTLARGRRLSYRPPIAGHIAGVLIVFPDRVILIARDRVIFAAILLQVEIDVPKPGGGRLTPSGDNTPPFGGI